MNFLCLQEALKLLPGILLEVSHYIATGPILSVVVSSLDYQARCIMEYMERLVPFNGSSFIKYIKHIRKIEDSKSNGESNYLIWLDNSTVHKNEDVRKYCREKWVWLLFITAYSPWLNPVEGLIGRIKAKLGSKKKQGK